MPVIPLGPWLIPSQPPVYMTLSLAQNVSPLISTVEDSMLPMTRWWKPTTYDVICEVGVEGRGGYKVYSYVMSKFTLTVKGVLENGKK